MSVPRFGATVLALLVVLGITALVAAPAGGPALLFSGVDRSLPESARQHIYTLLGLELTAGGKALQFTDMRDCGPVTPIARLLDLNGDAKPEVEIVGGNTCTSGGAGSNVWLFVSDAAGEYRLNLGFPGAGVTALESRSKGFADLVIGGPGFCQPVWRWDGSAYQFLRNQPAQRDGCAGR